MARHNKSNMHRSTDISPSKPASTVPPPMEDITVLLTDAAKASKELNDARIKARKAATAAIRLLEEKLKIALQGESLKGLPNLWPIQGEKPYRAARVRGNLATPLTTDGRPILCLDERGALVMAGVTPGGLSVSTVEDSEFLAEDLEKVLAMLVAVLREHITRVRATHMAYTDISTLATQVKTLVGGE